MHVIVKLLMAATLESTAAAVAASPSDAPKSATYSWRSWSGCIQLVVLWLGLVCVWSAWVDVFAAQVPAAALFAWFSVNWFARALVLAVLLFKMVRVWTVVHPDTSTQKPRNAARILNQLVRVFSWFACVLSFFATGFIFQFFYSHAPVCLT